MLLVYVLVKLLLLNSFLNRLVVNKITSVVSVKDCIIGDRSIYKER